MTTEPTILELLGGPLDGAIADVSRLTVDGKPPAVIYVHSMPSDTNWHVGKRMACEQLTVIWWPRMRAGWQARYLRSPRGAYVFEAVVKG